MGHAQKTSSAIRRLGSLSLIAAFLVLGFCPLRNVLCKLAQPEPVRKAQQASDYVKITSGKECEIDSRIRASVMGFNSRFYLELCSAIVRLETPRFICARSFPYTFPPDLSP